MTFQTVEMLSAHNVGEKGIETCRGLHLDALLGFGIDVVEHLVLRIPHRRKDHRLHALCLHGPEIGLFSSPYLLCDERQCPFELININSDIDTLQAEHLPPVILIGIGIHGDVTMHVFLAGLIMVVDIIHSADLFIPFAVKISCVFLESLVGCFEELA